MAASGQGTLDFAERVRDEINIIREARATMSFASVLRILDGIGDSVDRRNSSKSLYFIGCGDAVKVGVASDPHARLKVLQTGAPGPLRLIAAIPNAGHRENECHRRLSSLRLHGEWFRYSPEIDSLIEEMQ